MAHSGFRTKMPTCRRVSAEAGPAEAEGTDPLSGPPTLQPLGAWGARRIPRASHVVNWGLLVS